MVFAWGFICTLELWCFSRTTADSACGPHSPHENRRLSKPLLSRTAPVWPICVALGRCFGLEVNRCSYGFMHVAGIWVYSMGHSFIMGHRVCYKHCIFDSIVTWNGHNSSQSPRAESILWQIKFFWSVFVNLVPCNLAVFWSIHCRYSNEFISIYVAFYTCCCWQMFGVDSMSKGKLISFKIIWLLLWV